MRMAKRFVWDTIVFVLGTIIFKWVWPSIYKLAENALTGWASDQIATAFGIQSPSLAAVVNFAWEWGIPLGAALALALVVHYRLRTKTNEDPKHLLDEIIGLTEASGLVYEGASQKLRQDIRSGIEGGDAIIDRCKMFILTAASQGIIELQARRAPGLVREVISSEETNELFPNKGDAVGFLAHEDRYVDVAMKRSDVSAVVAYFEDDKPVRIQKHAKPQPLSKKTGLVWNITDHPENVVFLGLSVGSHGQLQAHHFAVKGWNKTISPITNPRAYIRAENTATNYSALFNPLIPGSAKLRPISEIETIPVGALIDITIPFRPDRTPIPLADFLTEFVPFTFIFESPEASYRQTITQKQIEHRIRLFQEAVNAKMITRPQIQARKNADGA